MKKHILTLMAGIISLASTAQKPGTLDIGFRKTGINIFDITKAVSDVSYAVAEQKDGKILVAGITNINFDQEGFVARFNTDGHFDSTFHFDGHVEIDMSNQNWDKFLDIAVRPDGKILVAGETRQNNNLDIMLVQFNTDGSIDPNFGSLGVVKLDLGSSDNDRPQGLLLLENGKCVVYGQTSGGSTFAFAVRFDSAGSLDKSFGKSGLYKWDETDENTFTGAVELPDKTLVLAGHIDLNNDWRAALIGLNEDGTLNTKFGNGGQVLPALTPDEDILCDIKLNSDKTKLVICGATNAASTDFFVAKFSLSGGADLNFANGGIVTIDLSLGGDDWPTTLLITADDKIMVAGNSVAKCFVTRMHADGTYDTAFNSLGYWVEDISPANMENFEDIMIDRNGKIVATGQIFKANLSSPLLVRLHGDPKPKPTTSVAPLKQSLNIYPNPVSSAFTIPVSDVSDITISDIQGKIIYAESIEKTTSDNLLINCEGWANGTYFVRISGSANIQTGIIIKQ